MNSEMGRGQSPERARASCGCSGGAYADASQLGVGAFICSLGVVLIPVVGRLFFRAEVSRRTWASVGLGAVGLGLLFVRAGFWPSTSDALFAATAGVNALHFNLNARYASRMPVRALTAVQLAVVGAMGLALSTVVEPWPGVVGLPTWVSWRPASCSAPACASSCR
jgi:hypothetical protein